VEWFLSVVLLTEYHLLGSVGKGCKGRADTVPTPAPIP
jgi:hypothetical protein